MRAFLSGWQVTRSSVPTSLPAPQPTIIGKDAPWHLHNMGQFAVPSFAFWNFLTFWRAKWNGV